jgi:hypothetical protein
MKTKVALARWLPLIICLCALSHIASAASRLSFTDTWKDAVAFDASSQKYYVKTTGSFSASISLPLAGVDLSEADAGTQFSLAIGPAGNTTNIISDTLGDAENYTPNKKSATFALIDPISQARNGSLTVDWTSTTISVTASASEDALGMEQMFVTDSVGTPTNTTLNSSQTGAYYEVSLLLDASDNGGGTYSYDNPFVPVAGSNKETKYSAPGGAGAFPLENGSLTGTGDFTPPKLTITSPKPGFQVYDQNPVIDLTGLASDGIGITNVVCIVEVTNAFFEFPVLIDQAEELPTNSIAWTAEVDLSQWGYVGTNEILVVAQDSAGNQSFVSRSFVWVETNLAAVNVNPTNGGTIKGITNGQVLQVGNRYAMTATPANKTWIFSAWTATGWDLLSSNARFDYIDTDGVLTATFVTNPFCDTLLAGTYTGLFFDPNNGPELDNAGYFTVAVTDTGLFTGKLQFADSAEPVALSGQLSVYPDGSLATATVPLKRNVTTTDRKNKTEYLEVSLTMNTITNLVYSGVGNVVGVVNSYSDPSETTLIDSAQLGGELSLPGTNVPSGLYDLVFSPLSVDGSEGPGGFSYATAKVSENGDVALVLTLADAISQPISMSTFVARDGTCPFYASLYGGKGLILGWVLFVTDGDAYLSGNSIWWLKGATGDNYYSSGFTNTPDLIGGLYVPPKAGTNIFAATNMTFIVDENYTGFSLPDETDSAVTFNPVNNSFSDTNKVAIAVTVASAALNGAFHPTGGKSAISFHGVEVGGAGYGYYADASKKETGPIFIVYLGGGDAQIPGGSGVRISAPFPSDTPSGGYFSAPGAKPQ